MELRQPVLGRIRRVHQYNNEESRKEKGLSPFTGTLDVVTTQGDEYRNVPVVTTAVSNDGKGFRYIPYSGVRVLILFTYDGPVVVGYVPEQDDLDGFSDSSSVLEQGDWGFSSPDGASVSVGHKKAVISASPATSVIQDGVNGIITTTSKDYRKLAPSMYEEYKLVGDTHYNYEYLMYSNLSEDSSLSGENHRKFSGYSEKYSTFLNMDSISYKLGDSELRLNKITRTPREMRMTIREDPEVRPEAEELTNPKVWEPASGEIRKSDRRLRVWNVDSDTRTEKKSAKSSGSNDWTPHTKEGADPVPDGTEPLSSSLGKEVNRLDVIARPQELRVKTADSESVIGQNIEFHSNRNIIHRGNKVIFQADDYSDGELDSKLERGSKGSRITLENDKLEHRGKKVSVKGDIEILLKAPKIKLRGEIDCPQLQAILGKMNQKMDSMSSKISNLEGQVAQLSSRLSNIDR